MCSYNHDACKWSYLSLDLYPGGINAVCTNTRHLCYLKMIHPVVLQH
jgi:hypothetical protein